MITAIITAAQSKTDSLNVTAALILWSLSIANCITGNAIHIPPIDAKIHHCHLPYGNDKEIVE